MSTSSKRWDPQVEESHRKPRGSDERDHPRRQKIPPDTRSQHAPLLKTISVSDIGSIRIKKRGGPSQGERKGDEVSGRRKSIFGKAGSLFDLFGFQNGSNNNEYTSSSSSGSSQDTVIESPEPVKVTKKEFYKSKSAANLTPGRISPLKVAPGLTFAEQIRLDKEQEEQEARDREQKLEQERKKRVALHEKFLKRREEEKAKQLEYEKEIAEAREQARARAEREAQARGEEDLPPVVSQKSLLIASKHLEEGSKKRNRKFSKAEMATAKSLLSKLDISKKSDKKGQTETDTIKIKKQKSRPKVLQNSQCFTNMYVLIAILICYNIGLKPNPCYLQVPEDLYKAVQQRTPNGKSI